MAAPIDTVLEIDTPEHLAFRAQIAGPTRRMFAYLIDLIVRSVILMVTSTLITIVFGSAGLQGVGTGLMLLAFFLLDWFYFVGFEIGTGGRSPGKMALKLRVLRPDGLPIGWKESILRNFLRAADILVFPPYVVFIGPAVMALDRRFRRMGDLVANTIVVIEESSRMTNRVVVEPNATILEELPVALPLSRDELEAIELFVSREHMSDARRTELAEIIADVLATKLHVTRPRNASAFLGSIWARAQDPKRRVEVAL